MKQWRKLKAKQIRFKIISMYKHIYQSQYHHQGEMGDMLCTVVRNTLQLKLSQIDQTNPNKE